MPTFQTPDPIDASVEVAAGSVRLTGTERDDTVVDVRPRDESRPADVKAAEQTRVDYRNGKLAVTAGKRGLSFGRTGAVEIDIALPSRSRLRATLASADVRADGEYAECRLSSASGDLAVERVTGNVEADTASGAITVQSAEGNVVLSTASGRAEIGVLNGDLKFRAASGELVIERLRGSVNARTASGSVAITSAVSGSVSVQTGSGDIKVGIAQGTAARLDLLTGSGTVTNRMQPSDGPAAGDETLVVQTRSGSGNVDIDRPISATVES
jgi:hypothetical protein